MNPSGSSLPLLGNQALPEDPAPDTNYLRGHFEEADFSIEAIQTLLEVSTQILATHDVESLLEQILKLLSRFVAYSSAAIHLVQGDFLSTRAGVGRSYMTVGQYNFHKQNDFVWQYLERERSPYFCEDVLEEEWTPLHGFEYIRSFLAVPLIINGKLIGLLTVDHTEPGQYQAKQVESVRLFANYAAIAIHNAQLLADSRRHIKDLEILQTVGIVSVQETLDTLANRLAAMIDADNCFLLLWDESSQRFVQAAIYQINNELNHALDFTENIFTESSFKTDTLFIVEDVYNSSPFSPSIVERLSSRSMLCMPLQVNAEKIGIALVGFVEKHIFTQDEINIGRQAAAQISIAIAKARLLEMERRQRQAAEIQLNFSFQLMETSTPDNAINMLLATISQLMDYDTGSVMLLEADNPNIGYIAAVSGYTNPAEALHRPVNLQLFPHLDQIRREGKEIYFPEIRENTLWRPSHQPDAGEVRSVLLVPLLYDQQSKMIGCLTLKSYRPNAFSAEERSNVTLLCNQTASAVRNLRLIEETHRRLNEVSILTEMSEILNRTLDLDKVLELVLDRVKSLLGQSTNTETLQIAIILRQPPYDTLRLAMGYNFSEEYRSLFNNRPFYASDGSFKQSILGGEWVELNDPAQIQEVVAEIFPGYVLTELLNIPLKVGSEIIGVITANRIAPDPLTRRLLRAIAQLAGSAIHKTRLLTQARNRAVELMEAHDALNEMDRVRDEFFQNITHDLRAPLTFIRGYTDLMIEGAMGEINEEQRDALEIIQDRTDAVSRLVSDILKIKQIESQPLREEPVEVVSIANTSIRSALMTARQAGLEILFESTTKEAIVSGDKDRLGQVFDNLLSNAIKYNREGGQVRIKIEQQWPNIVVSIADTGIGIPEEELDRVWNRYYRAQTALQHSGTGLGLANVRRIIEAHDGRIWVQSSPQGTTFTFELPLLPLSTFEDPAECG
jgi:signal transduction histidine kinase/putative methionine-R-sulfoxide reductase with GAF domain